MPFAAIFAFFNLSVFFQFITITAKRIAPARFPAKLAIHKNTPQKKEIRKRAYLSQTYSPLLCCYTNDHFLSVQKKRYRFDKRIPTRKLFICVALILYNIW